jgi:hypothetical protein
LDWLVRFWSYQLITAAPGFEEFTGAAQYWSATIFFWLFIFVGVIILLNIFTAILLDAVALHAPDSNE